MVTLIRIIGQLIDNFKLVELTERNALYVLYCIIDFAMAVIMLLFGIWFYRSKGQASKFLSGYNMKSAEERKKYDENAMCKAYGKRMMFMSIPFIAGMIIDIWYIGNRLFNCMGDMVCYVYSAAYG